MSRRSPYFGPHVNPVPVFGEPQIRIVIEIDAKGLMRTGINKPLPAFQVIGILLDSMQGQYQTLREQASMIIDPNKGRNAEGSEKENHDGGGNDPGGSPGTV